ncbi:hypothetical protein ACFFGT_14980 [Mucilaginibacter angelicae]|uniref:Uncharacterized protein n=1 Tax=Mucilaginibacter angelicae TaxID=869718 RepID=A0ABV6L7U7_9SPHI
MLAGSMDYIPPAAKNDAFKKDSSAEVVNGHSNHNATREHF